MENAPRRNEISLGRLYIGLVEFYTDIGVAVLNRCFTDLMVLGHKTKQNKERNAIMQMIYNEDMMLITLLPHGFTRPV